jgi:hypothetical protein
MFAVAFTPLIGIYSGNIKDLLILMINEGFSVTFDILLFLYYRAYEYPFRVLKDQLVNLPKQKKVIAH